MQVKETGVHLSNHSVPPPTAAAMSFGGQQWHLASSIFNSLQQSLMLSAPHSPVSIMIIKSRVGLE